MTLFEAELLICFHCITWNREVEGTRILEMWRGFGVVWTVDFRAVTELELGAALYR